jgi:hypothetical protein
MEKYIFDPKYTIKGFSIMSLSTVCKVLGKLSRLFSVLCQIVAKSGLVAMSALLKKLTDAVSFNRIKEY